MGGWGVGVLECPMKADMCMHACTYAHGMLNMINMDASMEAAILQLLYMYILVLCICVCMFACA